MAKVAGCPGYTKDAAPIICVEGSSQSKGSHKKIHQKFANALDNAIVNKATKIGETNAAKIKFKMGEVIDAGSQSVVDSFPESECSKKCIKAHYKKCHKKMGPMDDSAKPLSAEKNRLFK